MPVVYNDRNAMESVLSELAFKYGYTLILDNSDNIRIGSASGTVITTLTKVGNSYTHGVTYVYDLVEQYIKSHYFGS